MHHPLSPRPPLPPLPRETAAQKLRLAEHAWKRRDPYRGTLCPRVPRRCRQRGRVRLDQRLTMLNVLAGLTKLPLTAGLPMFEVMAVETLWMPTVENVTVKIPLPTMRPKLTRKVFGEKLAFGSVEFKVTV